jgi:hypothetical protein
VQSRSILITYQLITAADGPGAPAVLRVDWLTPLPAAAVVKIMCGEWSGSSPAAATSDGQSETDVAGGCCG